MGYRHVVTGLCDVKSYYLYPLHQAHDNHLIQWLKAKFDLTVEYGDYNGEWVCFKGNWDLDVPYITHNRIFDAALEYCACHDGDLFDKLIEIEGGR